MGSQTPTAPLRLAILEADTPLPSTKAKYTSYGGVFSSLLTRAAAPTPLSSIASLSYYNIVGPSAVYPSLDDIDAILITGSKHNAFEDGEGNWIANLTEFVRRALESERRIRVVGVCFGHQVVARALGVPVGRSAHGWEISVTEVKLSEKGREVFGQDTLVSYTSRSLTCDGANTVAENPPDAPRCSSFASGWRGVTGGNRGLSGTGLHNTRQGHYGTGTSRVYRTYRQGDPGFKTRNGHLVGRDIQGRRRSCL